MNDLEMMTQQFIGFNEGVVTGSITALIRAAGLTRDEWLQMRESSLAISPLSPKWIKEINDYFGI